MPSSDEAFRTIGEVGDDGQRPVEPLSGTVTFLFTDIEGSTRLWEEHPQAMSKALARHDAILVDAVESSGGHVVKTTGDGLFAVFGRAESASPQPWRRNGCLLVQPGTPAVSCGCGWACTAATPSFATAIITGRR